MHAGAAGYFRKSSLGGQYRAILPKTDTIPEPHRHKRWLPTTGEKTTVSLCFCGAGPLWGCSGDSSHSSLLHPAPLSHWDVIKTSSYTAFDSSCSCGLAFIHQGWTKLKNISVQPNNVLRVGVFVRRRSEVKSLEWSGCVRVDLSTEQIVI